MQHNAEGVLARAGIGATCKPSPSPHRLQGPKRRPIAPRSVCLFPRRHLMPHGTSAPDDPEANSGSRMPHCPTGPEAEPGSIHGYGADEPGKFKILPAGGSMGDPLRTFFWGQVRPCDRSSRFRPDGVLEILGAPP